VVLKNSKAVTDIQRITSSAQTIVDTYNASFEQLLKSMTPALKNFSSVNKMYSSTISDTLKQISDYYQDSLNATFSKVYSHQRGILEQMSPALRLGKQQQELVRTFQKVYTSSLTQSIIDTNQLSKVASSITSVLNEISIRNIDFSGVDNLNPLNGSGESEVKVDITATSNVEVAAVVEKQKKKLIDMTDEDVKKLISSAITPVKTFSIAAFIYNLYSDYVNDAAKVIIEVVFAFMFTTLTGQYNAEVKHAIFETIQETNAVTDTRKVITKFVKANPTDQVAFLRKTAFLRSGATRKAPITMTEKISTKTVLTVVERKNNWLKVAVDTGDFSGEVGWIEESKVIKFKKIK
jgi:hypothetical protein